ncbi:hypothetical protein Q4511_15655 [Paracoccus sp. 1_MG-2023]|uniref:hypothetical protein n=1 Tax=unclassified Paracoccus (in: a-proteobacteria) TaxID=2688777 RepID=UPI001C0A0892|nr:MULTISPECIES: hypothetical protein [unclassified Paracoccus (in: a-proteobacteria)]MBU2958012.1 hypothetical protein [Paracoccus sp. C2R09]MDO6670353.1 hypothetical protein [Paracoccus sp. 1_MG-2023]
MLVYVNPTLNGVCTEDRGPSLWIQGVYSDDDIKNLTHTRALILSRLRDAIEVRDYRLVDRLDEAYDDISILIEEVVSCWPGDYAPVYLEENAFF